MSRVQDPLSTFPALPRCSSAHPSRLAGGCARRNQPGERARTRQVPGCCSKEKPGRRAGFFFYLVDIAEATPGSQRLPARPQPGRVPPPQRCHRHRPHEAAAAEQQVLHPAHEHRSHEPLRWEHEPPVPAGCRWLLSLPRSDAWHEAARLYTAGGGQGCCTEPGSSLKTNSSFTALPGQIPRHAPAPDAQPAAAVAQPYQQLTQQPCP